MPDPAISEQQSMIERVARAIALCSVCEGEGHIADGLDEAACSIPCPPCFGTGYDARAVLNAIDSSGYVIVPKEPTEAMVEAGDELIPWTRGTESRRAVPNPEEVWSAMISAALNQEEPR